MSSSPSATALRASLDSAAQSAGHTLDPEQHAAADALASFGARLLSRRDDDLGGGLYLWGTVGRGKTWLADALFSALPLDAKRRRHFHSFYRDLHRDLYRGGSPAPGAIDTAIQSLIGGIDLLYFDEFHLHDAGDATLALRVLDRVIEARVPVLATSNYPPASLLPDPIFHHLFEPGVRLITAEWEVVSLDGVTDYRRGHLPDERREGFARGTWHQRETKSPQTGVGVSLQAGGHPVTAIRSDAAELVIGFDELCERPTSASDYLAWAERWQRWTVVGVPRLTTCSPQARQRFLNLVDVLNDRGVETDFVSAFSPEQVLEAGPVPTARGAAADREELGLGIDGLPIDVARTASRLALLRRSV